MFKLIQPAIFSYGIRLLALLLIAVSLANFVQTDSASVSLSHNQMMAHDMNCAGEQNDSHTEHQKKRPHHTTHSIGFNICCAHTYCEFTGSNRIVLTESLCTANFFPQPFRLSDGYYTYIPDPQISA
ncbi:hypothetical protein CHS0354_013127 [Potamilus streckersoni]|uniref:Uncharacterized protein n=1 Tax=Potamilus streckersoni TaxID=2493646 RepID=A0AAE0S6A0_9BIVA|nr:hypothetical protein CHS0354_013127 [Potamilus streckersoni]